MKLEKRLLSVSLITLLVLTVADPTLPAQQEMRTFVLENVGVAFVLPKQYSILEQQMSEGGYGVRVTFGKSLGPNHMNRVGVSLVLWPGAHDGFGPVPEYTPSQYIEVVYRKAKEGSRKEHPGVSEPQILKLFGNKAVTYGSLDWICCTFVFGRLKRSQLSGRAARYGRDYQVIIVSGLMDEESNDVFDALVDSLRLVK